MLESIVHAREMVPAEEGVRSGRTGRGLRASTSRGKPRREPSPLPKALDQVRRLRGKWSQSQFFLMRDRDIIETVLSLVEPKSNASLMALALHKNFGTFGRVINTSASALMATAGMTEAGALALRTVGQAALQMLRNAAFDGGKIECMKKFTSYLVARLQNERVEVLLAIFLNAHGRIIKEEEMARGTLTGVPVYPREIIRRCLELDATHIILAHNHPSGVVEPSAEDMVFTSEIVKAAELMDIYLVDHLIIGGGTYFSLHQEKLLV